MEEFGVEDPRITAFGDRYYFTYVAVSRHGAATALASTTDFRHFERHGIIFCPENKDVVLFPEKVGGEYRRAPSSERGDAVLPARDVGRAIARPDPLGPSRVPPRRRRRVGDRPRRRGDAAGARRCRLARDLPRQPPADPARRGRHVLDRSAAARSRQPGQDPPPDIGRRSSSRRPISSATASCRTWCSPPGSSRPGTRTWSTTGRPIRARRWWSSCG